MTRPSALPPRDAGLPGSEVLFDVEALRGLLGAGTDAAVRLRYVEHEPGERAVAMVAVDGRLAAVSVGATATVGDGVQVAWYPDDPGLPGLRSGWAPLLDALGVELGDQVEPERLTWVPHRRLVVSVGDVVVKLHASGDETQWAVDCAATVAAVVRVPDVLAADTGLAAHVQRRVTGRALGREDAIERIAPACEVLEHLRELAAARLVPYTADELLAHGRRVAGLVGFVAPHERRRLDDVIGRLVERRPGAAGLVAAHGDFNVGQLLVGDDGTLVLVDTDTLCAAAPGYDPASYAANLVAGRPGDLDDAHRTLGAFHARLPGLDRSELDWFLAAMVMRRLDRGLRRYKRDWPARTERLVDAAVELAEAL
jgi:hypothetical protein